MRLALHIIASLWLFLVSCESGPLEFESEQEMMAYLNDVDNGFIQRFESTDMLFSTKLVPPLAGDSSGQFAIHLKVNTSDGEAVLMHGDASQQESMLREGYLSFDIIEDVFLEVDGRTVKPLFHHYERNYGIKPGIDIVFIFDKVAPKDDVYFVYRDELFSQGLVRIKYNKTLFNDCYVS